MHYQEYDRLSAVERELENKCWHNACHELRDFLQFEFRFEKQILTDTVYMLKKYLKSETVAAGEIIKYVCSLSRDQMAIKQKEPRYEKAKRIESDCYKKQAKWYKRVWERIIIFSRWYMRFSWVTVFLVLIYPEVMRITSDSFVTYVVFQLCMVMSNILLLIAFFC